MKPSLLASRLLTAEAPIRLGDAEPARLPTAHSHQLDVAANGGRTQEPVHASR